MKSSENRTTNTKRSENKHVSAAADSSTLYEDIKAIKCRNEVVWDC